MPLRCQAQTRFKRIVESPGAVAVKSSDGRVRIEVDVNAWQEVALTMHPAKHVGVREIESLEPAVQRRPQPFRYQRVRVRETVAGSARFQHPHGDR
jgi:hypothetical protein